MSEEGPNQNNESAPSDEIEAESEPVTEPVEASPSAEDASAADAVRENLAANSGKKVAKTSVPAAGKGGNLSDSHDKHDDHPHHENRLVTGAKYVGATLLTLFSQFFGWIGESLKAGGASFSFGGAKKEAHAPAGGKVDHH